MAFTQYSKKNTHGMESRALVLKDSIGGTWDFDGGIWTDDKIRRHIVDPRQYFILHGIKFM